MTAEPSSVTPADVAAWMADELERVRWLYQEDAVHQIEQRFGAEFVYENENGNPAVARPVLRAFRERTEGLVVWERGERMWRYRESHDGPGRTAD